ncbi:hypothetical protein N2152v2_009132 [Parachlorella kessleri]
MALAVKLDESVEPLAEVVALQPVAIVDHVCVIDESVLRSMIQDEVGGSHRVEMSDIQALLAAAGEYYSKVGARGFDEWGVLFISSMKRAGVNVDSVITKPGPTGRCTILSCGGQRTMRTSLTGCARITPEELQLGHLSAGGTKWAFLNAYCLYNEGLLERAIELAGKAGVSVAFDLASFEVVRAFRAKIRQLLESGAVACCFCNEDEAREIEGGGAVEATPEAGLAYLAAHCQVAVVTLGEKGCIVQEQGGEVVRESACSGVKVVDSTGAGDLFAAGFLYGRLRGYPLRRCAQIGCMAGGAVVQTLGAEMSPANWQWLHSRMHGELAGAVVRDSAAAVQQELLACYALIEARGRGVVYYGSARLRQDSAHWGRAVELGRGVARLLGCTTWSGGGPGMMEAATIGALEAGGAVGGIRISREAGTTVRTASYLPPDSAVFCRFLSSRKVALVDCGVRMQEGDKTAYIFLPGGLGTMDELFEILTLMQLRKLGSKFPVPLILVNYDGVYDGLLSFLQACDVNGTLGAAELKDVIVASSNRGVLESLAQCYGLPLQPASAAEGEAGEVLLLSAWIDRQLGRAVKDNGLLA